MSLRRRTQTAPKIDDDDDDDDGDDGDDDDGDDDGDGDDDDGDGDGDDDDDDDDVGDDDDDYADSTPTQGDGLQPEPRRNPSLLMACKANIRGRATLRAGGGSPSQGERGQDGRHKVQPEG